MMKRLYDIATRYYEKAYNAAYQYFKKNDDEKVMIFRWIVLCVWINLVAIFILAKINPLQLLNPYKLGAIPPVDTRKEIILYYPASIDDLHEKNGSGEKSSIVEIRQPANVNENYESPQKKKELMIQNAWQIIEQLSVAPVSIRGVRAIHDELLVKSIWFYEGQLIVHLDKARVEEVKEPQRNILVTCIRKSMQANLGAFTEIMILIQ